MAAAVFFGVSALAMRIFFQDNMAAVLAFAIMLVMLLAGGYINVTEMLASMNLIRRGYISGVRE
jgi:hypothetical protein